LSPNSWLAVRASKQADIPEINNSTGITAIYEQNIVELNINLPMWLTSCLPTWRGFAGASVWFERSAIWQAGINHESGQKLPSIFDGDGTVWAVAQLSMPEFRDIRSWTPHAQTLPIPTSSLVAKVMIGQSN
jgi:hypothetical protein